MKVWAYWDWEILFNYIYTYVWGWNLYKQFFFCRFLLVHLVPSLIEIDAVLYSSVLDYTNAIRLCNHIDTTLQPRWSWWWSSSSVSNICLILKSKSAQRNLCPLSRAVCQFPSRLSSDSIPSTLTSSEQSRRSSTLSSVESLSSLRDCSSILAKFSIRNSNYTLVTIHTADSYTNTKYEPARPVSRHCQIGC